MAEEMSSAGGAISSQTAMTGGATNSIAASDGITLADHEFITSSPLDKLQISKGIQYINHNFYRERLFKVFISFFKLFFTQEETPHILKFDFDTPS
jgi:hypothetical protein